MTKSGIKNNLVNESNNKTRSYNLAHYNNFCQVNKLNCIFMIEAHNTIIYCHGSCIKYLPDVLADKPIPSINTLNFPAFVFFVFCFLFVCFITVKQTAYIKALSLVT